jgi:hypothetical protein
MTVPADRPKPQPSGHFVLVPEHALPRIVIRSPRHIERGPGGLLAAIAARARLGRFDYETLITGCTDLIPLQRLSIAKIDWAHTIVPVTKSKAL